MSAKTELRRAHAWLGKFAVRRTRGAKRYPSLPKTKAMGFASLYPSYALLHFIAERSKLAAITQRGGIVFTRGFEICFDHRPPDFFVRARKGPRRNAEALPWAE